MQEMCKNPRPAPHKKPAPVTTMDRLDMLWEKYPQYREMKPFGAMDELIAGHESWQADFEEVREEYAAGGCDRFLVQLSLADLPYRHATKALIEEAGPLPENPYVAAFLAQFEAFDTDEKACFLFPESMTSQFFVVTEVCKNAEVFRPVRNLFPDEETMHFLAVFDKADMDDILLLYHLLYTNPAQDLFGAYTLFDYSLPWYATHLSEKNVVLRSPYLPDRTAKYLGALPWHFNPAKTVAVRRNIAHILENGYFASELEFFRNLTQVIMPYFQWWYEDIARYEEKDGLRTDWRLARTKIRTRLTAEGVIRPKWKHELSLFQEVRKCCPGTLYQYRPDWLGRQSLDLYIPELRTAIEYQGIQHFLPVSFFGGEDALAQRKELDRQKKELCAAHNVRLIEWDYRLDPSEENVRCLLS